MKLYTESDLIDLVQSLKDYTRESRQVLGYDEREPQEFVDIFLKDRTPIELPSDEHIYNILRGKKMFEKDWGFIEGAKWMRDKILNK